jgi:hypothetical protein
MSEEWRPVVGYEGHYEVSDLGGVRSIRNNHGNPRCRPLKLSISHDGYHRVQLSKGRVFKKFKVHVLVLEAFVGPRPEGMLGCHNDDDGLNNDLGNLRWDTPRGNYDDIVKRDARKGTRHSQCTITEDVARKIKTAAKDKTRWANDIAKEFGTTKDVVLNIRRSKTWAWLEV